MELGWLKLETTVKMCSNYRQRFVISERKNYLKKVEWINRLGVHFWSGEGKFSDWTENKEFFDFKLYPYITIFFFFFFCFHVKIAAFSLILVLKSGGIKRP